MIRIRDLQKKYKGIELNVSLEVPEGCVSGLIGKNGAGKSTTIKAILGLIRPDGGDISILGKAPSEYSASDREAIGAALSDSGFCPQLCVEDVVHILRSMYKSFEEERFRNFCKKHELPFDKKIKDFSSGMKAKLKVLAAICHNSKLLVLDEPTSGLDVLARNEILDLLRAYMEEDDSRSILISSHISTDLEGLCDDIYMIDKGRIILHEDTDRILGQYGILKLSNEEYASIDKQYIMAERSDKFSHSCLTNEKQYYRENYPDIVIENGSIDDMIVLMLGGERK